MKKVLIPLAIAMTISASPVVQAANIAQNLCNYVAADDKKRLRSFLKTNKLKVRSVFKGVQCNGKNLLAFASSRGSIQTGSLIISKLPKKIVASNLSAMQTGPQILIDAANKRAGV